MLPVITLFSCRSTPPRRRTEFGRVCLVLWLIIFIEHRMLVREPVHGMQGVLERLLDSG